MTSPVMAERWNRGRRESHTHGALLSSSVEDLALVVRAHEIGQAGVLVAVAVAMHVLVGGAAIVVPGSVSTGSVNAALLAGLLAGAGVSFAIATPTPWWAWSSRRPPALITAVALAAALVGVLITSGVAQVITGRPALAGWCGSIGLALLVLTALPRPALAAMVTSAVGIALVAIVPGEAPGSVLGLSPATWYDLAPPLGSRGTPYAVLALGVCGALGRVLLTGRTVRS